VLDTYGRANIYADGQYKFVIKTSAGVTVATYDNLEFVSAVSPTTLAVTSATIASMTATELYAQGGTIANATFSGGLVSNSSLGNCAILAAPTAASHPVNLSYLQTEIASQASFDAAALAAHVADSTDPHGSTLTQNTVISSSTVTDQVGKSGEGRLTFTATGATLIGGTTDNCLAFAANGFDTDYQIRHYAGGGYLDLHLLLSSQTVRVSPYLGGSIDFGGLTLKNFVISGFGGGEAQIFDMVSTTPAVLPYASAVVVLTSVLPASFTAGYYSVNWGGTVDNVSGGAVNMVQVNLLKNGSTIQQSLTHGFSSYGHSYDYAEVAGYRTVYLTAGDYLQISGSAVLAVTGSPPNIFRAYICATLAGTSARSY